MKKRLQKLLVCILVIFLATPRINTLASQSYTEKEIPFKHKTNLCENGPWELNKTSSGMIYAYEWDTYYTLSATTDSFWVGLNKMKWSEDGKLSYQAISLSSKFYNRISSGDNIWATKQDKYSNLFVAYQGDYAGESDVPMLTVLDKKGTVVNDLVLDDVLKHYISGSSIDIKDIHITGNTIALLVSEDYSQTSIQLFNWKTKKRLSTQKLSTMRYVLIIGNYLYGIKSSDSANASSKTTDSDSSKYQLIKYSLDGKKVLWSPNLPNGELDMDSTYNKFSYDTVGDTIYVCNQKGIYSANTSKENSTFSLVMSANQSQYLSKYYTIVDFRVISKDRFYLLSIAGEDEEWPTNLAMYTRI